MLEPKMRHSFLLMVAEKQWSQKQATRMKYDTLTIKHRENSRGPKPWQECTSGGEILRSKAKLHFPICRSL